MSLVMNFVYQATAFVALMALDHRRQTADRSVWHTGSLAHWQSGTL